MDVVVIGRGVRSRPQSPVGDNGDRIIGELNATLVRASLFDQFDDRFCVLLRRSVFPRFGFEPIVRGSETLCFEKGRAHVLMVRAGELDMMGELVEQFATQGCWGPRHPDNDGLRRRPILATILQLPPSGESGRRDAVMAGRDCGEKVVPGLDGQFAEIIRDGFVEAQLRDPAAATGKTSERNEGCQEETTKHIVTITRCSVRTARAIK